MMEIKLPGLYSMLHSTKSLFRAHPQRGGTLIVAKCWLRECTDISARSHVPSLELWGLAESCLVQLRCVQLAIDPQREPGPDPGDHSSP